MLKVLQDLFIQEGRNPKEVFRKEDFDNSEFRRIYADYLFGEIKDSLSFYHTSREYELFVKFFEYLEGKPTFTYYEYITAYDRFALFLHANRIEKPNFFGSADTFLQYLYELNVICYIEETQDEKTLVRWCFRERSTANISPKVKTHCTYEIHYGLRKAINIGKPLKAR